ncbi:cysteine-rich repeat secretory protein 55-like [Humulus lupulus]|uniref:cysteine-rich repeat secretory protein 55-like n=1 Tax=Humulus lupulus TaxID=3486 RepID=UPI002B401C81|nr:cysteine-rich repeat secretory protein 55-like [Humulus lupulus]
MKTSHFSALLLLHLLALSVPCNTDTNIQTNFQCSEADDSATEMTFQTNLGNLLATLVSNGPVQKGFYKTRTGKKSNRVYGLIQCRGDISADRCSNCTKSSMSVALNECPKSKEVSVWFRWCFLHYADRDFFGVMEQASIVLTNDTDFDDPSVVSKGLELVSGLTSSVQMEPLGFQTEVLGVGSSGKRYGMVQCNRDISSSDCGRCLESQLAAFRTTIGNKRDWEVYGSSCFMWYHDYQFYFNFSISASKGVVRSFSHKGSAIGLIVAAFPLVL